MERLAWQWIAGILMACALVVAAIFAFAGDWTVAAASLAAAAALYWSPDILRAVRRGR